MASNEFLVSVTAIEFADIRHGVADLANGRLPYLRTVVLPKTSKDYSAPALVVFKDCQYLETVDLSRSLVTGSGLQDLRFWPIKDLNLSNSKFNDHGAAGLTEVGRRRFRLSLAATEITDEGLERLKSLRVWTRGIFSGTRISGAGLPLLAQLH